MTKTLSVLAIIFIINSAVLCHDQSAGEKKPRLTQEVNDVICPQAGYKCPDNNTCCTMSEGLVGCCPLPKAVCCSDGEHCCPEGYTCDVEEQTCKAGNSEYIPKQKEIKDVVCPGGSYECADGQTCCPLSSGAYGCCPLPNAVCCSDGIHCCPEGYTCDVSEGTCQLGKQILLKFLKKPFAPIPQVKPNTKEASKVSLSPLQKLVEPKKEKKDNDVKAVICPGGQYYCADGQTCCPNLAGGWNCCPYPSAVCCQDHVHCCPYATWCNPTTLTCNRSSFMNMMISHSQKAQKLQ